MAIQIVNIDQLECPLLREVFLIIEEDGQHGPWFNPDTPHEIFFYKGVAWMYFSVKNGIMQIRFQMEQYDCYLSDPDVDPIEIAKKAIWKPWQLSLRLSLRL